MPNLDTYKTSKKILILNEHLTMNTMNELLYSHLIIDSIVLSVPGGNYDKLSLSFKELQNTNYHQVNSDEMSNKVSKSVNGLNDKVTE